jgi:hypothetical protein
MLPLPFQRKEPNGAFSRLRLRRLVWQVYNTGACPMSRRADGSRAWFRCLAHTRSKRSYAQCLNILS